LLSDNRLNILLLNPDDGSDELLLLLFFRDELLLPSPLKALNPPNGLYTIVPKYENTPLLILSVLVILFC